MKNTKRILVLMLVLIMAFGAVEAASAVSFSFTFDSISENYNTSSGTVSPDASYFVVKLNNSSTASSNNVFGFRARKSSDDSYASSYKTMSSVGKKTVSYYSSITEGTSVYLRCKKDDSSTYAGPLNADGTFIP